MNKREEAFQQAMKRYAEHFRLVWEDDVSSWEDEIGPTTGGGAWTPSMLHNAPMLYMTWHDALNTGAHGPWMLLTYNEAKQPRDISTDSVTLDKLEDAIARNDPLHDPIGTAWADKIGGRMMLSERLKSALLAIDLNMEEEVEHSSPERRWVRFIIPHGRGLSFALSALTITGMVHHRWSRFGDTIRWDLDGGSQIILGSGDDGSLVVEVFEELRDVTAL